MRFDILYLIISVIFYSLDFFFLLRFMKRAYGERRRSRCFMPILVFLGILSFLLQYTLWYETYSIIAIAVSFLLLGFYSANLQRKILFSTSLFCVIGFWSMGYNFITILFQPDFSIIELNFITVIIWDHIITCLLLEVFSRLLRSSTQTLPWRYWFLLFCIPCVSIPAFFANLITILYNTLSRSQLSVLQLLIQFTFLFINAAALLLYDRLTFFLAAASENAVLKQQMHDQKQYFRDIEQSQNEVRGLRHDMKNMFQTASYLAEKREYEELHTYLQKLTSQAKHTEPMIATGNLVLDSVLNVKFLSMKKQRIKIETKIAVPPTLDLDFDQAAVLFGNILDNAAEACLKLPEEGRWIKLQISYTQGNLFLHLQNPTTEPVTASDGLYMTTKREKAFHGLGLKNVQRVTDQFHGTLNVSCEENIFHTKIVLYDI